MFAYFVGPTEALEPFSKSSCGNCLSSEAGPLILNKSASHLSLHFGLHFSSCRWSYKICVQVTISFQNPHCLSEVVTHWVNEEKRPLELGDTKIQELMTSGSPARGLHPEDWFLLEHWHHVMKPEAQGSRMQRFAGWGMLALELTNESLALTCGKVHLLWGGSSFWWLTMTNKFTFPYNVPKHTALVLSISLIILQSICSGFYPSTHSTAASQYLLEYPTSATYLLWLNLIEAQKELGVQIHHFPSQA